MISQVIAGVDPGTNLTGYGVIKTENNSSRWLASGVIATSGAASLAEKLAIIYSGLQKIFMEVKPDRVCVEQAFYAKNVHTSMILGHARGVALLAAHQCGAVVTEYTPREIKKALVGTGAAEKQQVAYMVKLLLKPPCEHLQTDAYDALGIALCDFFHQTKLGIMSRSK